jgi:N-acylneuraminate cytidylyltransferase
MREEPRAVALIPARSGSRRVAGKNVRLLGRHPLLAYTIEAARRSGVFEAVVVSTDAKEYAEVARHYGAEAPFLRPPELARALSPDIEFVAHALEQLDRGGRRFDAFSILRPTSPFRQAETIRRAWREFRSAAGADSLRAVEPCRQHPGKMWVVRGERMYPLLPLGPPEQPWHSTPYQGLPPVFVQNASLELAWTRCVTEGGTIAGETIVPLLTRGLEGFDINDPDDWAYAELLVSSGRATLPPVERPPVDLESLGLGP